MKRTLQSTTEHIKLNSILITNMTKTLFSALGKAASFTVRGATVTFGSTIFSCMAACKIEQGANQMIYKYFPHKFANVEYANGLTKEQLDAVRMYRDATDSDIEKSSKEHETPVVMCHDTAQNHDLRRQEQQQKEIKKTREEDFWASKAYKTKFWKESEETFTSLISVEVLPRQEIMSCAITC